MPDTEPSRETVDAFIGRWEAAGASERANYQLFLTELCDLLGVPGPDPATPDAARNTYIFERAVSRRDKDGNATTVYLDLYKAGHFVLETKQGASTAQPDGATRVPGGAVATRVGHGRRGTKTWDKALDKAYHQARAYIRDLPVEEGRPPFLIVCDVGHLIELYAEFTGTGGQYLRFPDPQNHRIYLEDLRDREKRDLLRAIWMDPHALDPSTRSAKVTRKIADALAQLATSLESAGHHPEQVAIFLQRCLFTLFAEDIGLLPSSGFENMLRQIQDSPQGFVVMAGQLWQEMATGAEFSSVLMKEVAHFNGGLFDEPSALPLDADQVAILLHAAKQDWRDVEPAIFGTLLERALDPRERRKIGAHYTPRAYVDRLVDATMMRPLREQWVAVKAAASQHHDFGDDAKARKEIETFHRRLCKIRVLDPACGSGNFLYVALARMKELEAEMLDLLEALGGNRILEMNSVKVRPHQVYGLDTNEQAVAIAQLVVWIGYFQWHLKATGDADTNDRPLIPKQATIRRQDAVLAYSDKLPRESADGSLVRVWDGQTTKRHPTTGEQVPDDEATMLLFDYTSPARPEWPEAEYIVGNPPFIGAKAMRSALGDGYTTALRKVWKDDVPESADFVMFWWKKAAELVRERKVERFGFITTNSIRQTFNRRVVETVLSNDGNPLHLAYAIPDHPWVDSADGADVRIAMTVMGSGSPEGTLETVIAETEVDSGEHEVTLLSVEGLIGPNLTIGVPISSALRLRANQELVSRGVQTIGSGFVLKPEQIPASVQYPSKVVRVFLNGRDVAHRPRNVFVVDFYGLSEAQVRENHPELYQLLHDTVRPIRLQNKRASYREKWWVLGEPQPALRQQVAGLQRFVVTPVTAKHRFFVFCDPIVLPDQALNVFATDDAYLLATLSSVVHVRWALAAGGRLDLRPRYNNTRCFETFPFPDLAADDPLITTIRDYGERLDSHRKARQAAHPDLTMTGMYNVLQKLRRDDSLGSEEKATYDCALIGLLRQLHDELDAAVLRAYGWQDLEGPTPIADRIARGDTDLEQELLKRLVELNHARTAEEDQGNVRYLRPEFQDPDFGKKTRPVGTQSELPTARPSQPPKKGAKLTWPKDLPSQVAAIQKLLVNRGPDAAVLSAVFGRKSKKREQQVAQILQTLESLGQL